MKTTEQQIKEAITYLETEFYELPYTYYSNENVICVVDGWKVQEKWSIHSKDTLEHWSDFGRVHIEVGTFILVRA